MSRRAPEGTCWSFDDSWGIVGHYDGDAAVDLVAEYEGEQEQPAMCVSKGWVKHVPVRDITACGCDQQGSNHTHLEPVREGVRGAQRVTWVEPYYAGVQYGPPYTITTARTRQVAERTNMAGENGQAAKPTLNDMNKKVSTFALEQIAEGGEAVGFVLLLWDGHNMTIGTNDPAEPGKAPQGAIAAMKSMIARLEAGQGRDVEQRS